MLRPENVSDPEQPLKSCPTVMLVTLSLGEIVKATSPLDSTITLNWVKDITDMYERDAVLRARNATVLERPTDVKRFFKSQLAPIVPSTPVGRRSR